MSLIPNLVVSFILCKYIYTIHDMFTMHIEFIQHTIYLVDIEKNIKSNPYIPTSYVYVFIYK